MKQFLRYIWNTITHPQANFDALASQPSIRWALLAATLPILQVWGNVALHTAFGLDWLGTKPLLADPTFVGGFGYWRVNTANWLPIFVILMPLLSFLNLVIISGTAHSFSKLWKGHGSFEQMVNTLAFASMVPNLFIAGLSEWIFGVPIDLITGHPYWWTTAMQGGFGPVAGTIWNAYVYVIYLGFQWIWTIALGSIAIRRVQRIPAWASIFIMLITFVISMFIASVFTR